ncbi:MAG TPA: hypothetical protein VF092_10640 [Longimicrobium sp.]
MRTVRRLGAMLALAVGGMTDGAAAQLTDSVQVSVAVPATVRAGRPVPIRVSLTNRLDRPVTLRVPPNQPPDWLVRVIAGGGLVVWLRRDFDTGFQRGVLTLPPRASVVRTIVWDQRDIEGRQVPRGVYRVWVFFYAPTLPRGRAAEAGLRIR